MGEGDSRLSAKQLHQEVIGGGVAETRVVEAARLGLGQGDEVGERRRRYTRVQQKQQRLFGEQRDRGKILRRIRDRLHARPRHRHLTGGANQQGVAIGRRLRDGIGTERAGCTGPIFHDHRLAPAAGQPLRSQPSDDIGAAAGRIADNKANGTGWKDGLGPSGQGEGGADQGAAGKAHGVRLLPVMGDAAWGVARRQECLRR